MYSVVLRASPEEKSRRIVVTVIRPSEVFYGHVTGLRQESVLFVSDRRVHLPVHQGRILIKMASIIPYYSYNVMPLKYYEYTIQCH